MNNLSIYFVKVVQLIKGPIQDQDGNKHYSFEINGDNFVFIDGKREEVKEEE
jgi:hypothetical protein